MEPVWGRVRLGSEAEASSRREVVVDFVISSSDRLLLRRSLLRKDSLRSSRMVSSMGLLCHINWLTAIRFTIAKIAISEATATVKRERNDGLALAGAAMVVEELRAES